jgi:glycerophosphoryl diester phosphodiesterase
MVTCDPPGRVATEGAAAPGPGRRTVLRWLVGGSAVAAGLGACGGPSPARAPATDGPWTVDRWRRDRGSRTLVAHRGSGDVVPEHTLEAYAAALAWGARALEISVCRTSDGVLVCNHDLTLDRTTDLTGPVAEHTIAQLDAGRVEVPRLGPRWQGGGRPRIAHLDAALDLVGSRAILCLEAKDDRAYPALMEVVHRRRLARQVIVKAHASSARIEEAKKSGFPVFAYLGSAEEVTPAAIDALAARLTPSRDVLVLPAYGDGGRWLADDLVLRAIGTGVDVWVFPLHRRSDLAHFISLGVDGAVAASYGYLAGTVSPDAAPWPGDALRAGTLTRFPDSARFGLGWPEAGVATLGLQGEQHFVTLGQYAPPTGGAVRCAVELDVRFELASDGTAPEVSTIALSLGHADDRYLDLSAPADGHHVLISTDGSLSVVRGGGPETVVVADAAGPTIPFGTWVPLRLTVEAERLTCERRDTRTWLSCDGVDLAAGYLHVGRVSRAGSASLRRLVVSLR